MNIKNRVFSFNVALAILGCAFSPALRATPVVFSDGNFSGWQVGPAFPGTYPAQQISLEPAGGNSGSYWRVTTLTNVVTFTSFFKPLFTYDPSPTGKIDSINFSIDAREFASFLGGMTYGLAVLQDGQVFASGTSTQGQALGGWTSFSGDPSWYTDGFFYAAAGPIPPGNQYAPNLGISPDFSATGSQLTFGFFTGNQGGSGIQVGYDNFRIQLNTSAASVPDEVSTILILGLGLGSLFVMRTNKRRAV